MIAVRETEHEHNTTLYTAGPTGVTRPAHQDHFIRLTKHKIPPLQLLLLKETHTHTTGNAQPKSQTGIKPATDDHYTLHTNNCGHLCNVFWRDLVLSTRPSTQSPPNTLYQKTLRSPSPPRLSPPFLSLSGVSPPRIRRGSLLQQSFRWQKPILALVFTI